MCETMQSSHRLRPVLTKENLLDQGTIEQTLQLGSCFCELGSFGVDGIMKEDNELTVALDKVREITLFMIFDEIFLVGVSSFGVVHVLPEFDPKVSLRFLMRTCLSRKEPWLFPSAFATFFSWASENFTQSVATSPVSRSLFDISATAV